MVSIERAAARESPYQGLTPFSEQDAPYFFGREKETRLIVASLFAAPLTLLYGASGVGKSSILRAGVIPQLRKRANLLPVIFPVPVDERDLSSASVVVRGWQVDPVEGIKEAIAHALLMSSGDDKKRYSRYQDGLNKQKEASLPEFLSYCHKLSQYRLMVILDQFEEHSLYYPQGDPFAEQFPHAIARSDQSVSFLLSLREDSFSKLDRYRGQIPMLFDSCRRIEHLGRAAAEDAIRLPLQEYNRHHTGSEEEMRIEDELVKDVLDQIKTDQVYFGQTGGGSIEKAKDALDSGIETPYLQLVMMRLWEREQQQGSHTLRSSTLNAEGGAVTIVRTHLDRIMSQFSPEEQDIAARVFHRLVTPSGAKLAISAQDLAEFETIEKDQLGPILHRLAGGSRRILRVSTPLPTQPDEPLYEIFHDRLGKAILAWRAERQTEQAREESRRQQAEQKQLAEESRSRAREYFDHALARMSEADQRNLTRILPFLVTASGVKIAQTAKVLEEYTGIAPQTIEPLLQRLCSLGILKALDANRADGDRFEIVYDTLGPVMQEWQADLLQNRAKTGAASQLQARSFDSDTSSRSLRRFPYALVSGLLYKGQVLPFLGPGASSKSGIHRVRSGAQELPSLPDLDELRRQLAAECDFPADRPEAQSLAGIASYYVQSFGRHMLYERLHSILTAQGLVPSRTYRYLASVACDTPMVIVTTNWDTLLEQAFAEAGAPCVVITCLNPEDRPGIKSIWSRPNFEARPVSNTNDVYIDVTATNVILKLYGSVDPSNVGGDSYVITEKDHIDLIGRLWVDAIPKILASQILSHHLLAIGYSADDWPQRALMHAFKFDRFSIDQRAWAVQLDPSILSVIAWQQYEINIYNEEIDTFAAQMQATTI